MKVPAPRKLKSGTWFIQLRLGGQSVSVTASTKLGVIHKAEVIKAEYRAGKRATVSGAVPTLRKAMAEYINSRRAVLSPSTIVGYQDIQRNRFQAYMDKPLDRIDWQQAVNREGKSAKTIKNALGLVRSVYKQYSVPFPEVRLPAAVKSEHPWLTPDEIKTFIAAMRGTRHEIPALLALHSLRKSEVCALDWSDIDLDTRTIHVNGALLIDETGTWIKRDQNKTVSSNRVVRIFIPELLEALQAVEDKTGRVVKVHPETPYRAIQAVCKANGLPQVGWHGLRHSFASLCYSLGVNEMTCMQLGGWSDYQTMRKIYTHLAESDKIKIVDQLELFFQNANQNANE